MDQQVDAVYENGMLRPLGPLTLAESQRVSITVSDPDASGSVHRDDFLAAIRAEVANLEHFPTIEEVQRALSKIPESLVEDFIAERENRF
ncbi:MAG: antitoxin family protein [Acidobacteriia bacterium]|nr:antitoxin family protein [Terriglobia bacterium]